MNSRVHAEIAQKDFLELCTQPQCRSGHTIDRYTTRPGRLSAPRWRSSKCSATAQTSHPAAAGGFRENESPVVPCWRHGARFSVEATGIEAAMGGSAPTLDRRHIPRFQRENGARICAGESRRVRLVWSPCRARAASPQAMGLSFGADAVTYYLCTLVASTGPSCGCRTFDLHQARRLAASAAVPERPLSARGARRVCRCALYRPELRLLCHG